MSEPKYTPQERREFIARFEAKYRAAITHRNRIIQLYDEIKDKLENLQGEENKFSLQSYVENLKKEGLEEKETRWKKLAAKHKPLGCDIDEWWSYLSLKRVEGSPGKRKYFPVPLALMQRKEPPYRALTIDREGPGWPLCN